MTTTHRRATSIGVRLSRSAVDVEAGGQADLTVTVRNDGAVVDQVRIEVLGMAAPWAQLAPSVVGLFPAEEAVVHVQLSPPRSRDLLLEEVPFAVKVTSEADPGASVVEEGVVRIGAFRDVAAELRPRSVTARRTARFALVLSLIHI